ncbi:MAG: hypothetical protein R3E90_07385 [Marinicella sp.]|nr:hypothetical protein [Xanthomonadales bacterium]
MNSLHIKQQSTHNHPANQQTIIISKDLWMGESEGEYLFKLCGTDEVVWIPGEMVQTSYAHAHAFEVNFTENAVFSCAKIMISNFIRLCLIKQHQVSGKQILPFLLESEKHLNLQA